MVKQMTEDQNGDMSVIWMPDPSVLYIMHRAPGQFLDKEIIMKPQVIREKNEEFLCFITNRGHMLKGKLINVESSGIMFDWQDGNSEWDGPIYISEMTRQEFVDFQERRAMERNVVPEDMDELMGWMQEEAAWG